MRCSWLVLVAACTDPPQAQLIQVRGVATEELTLDPGVEPDVDSVAFRWDLAARPDGSTATKSASSGHFIPDIRGAYLIELWESASLAERLFARFELTVAGDPPTAEITAPASIAVGASVTADGQTSTSREHRTLTYHWRLASRPLGSTTNLASVGDPTTTFVPDVAGDYGLQLSVFDGELWSTGPANATVTATAP